MCVDAILAGLEAGAAQVYVPEYFAGIAASKAKDVGKFFEGTAATCGNRSSRSRSRRERRYEGWACEGAW